MGEFDPSECDTTEPERIFCKKCADKAADGYVNITSNTVHIHLTLKLPK